MSASRSGRSRSSFSSSSSRSFRVLEVRWPRVVEQLPGYAVGTLGADWTIQRTLVLLGGTR